MGSWATLAWAREQRTGAPGRKAVLMVLAEYADENDSCYPGQPLIADATEQSVRTVRTHLDVLELNGLIARQHRSRHDGTGRTTDRYVLLTPAQVAKIAGSPNGNGDGGKRQPVADECRAPDVEAQELLPAPETPTARAGFPTSANVSTMDAAFEDFWSVYPRKTSKGTARRAWVAACRKAGDPDVIIEAAARYAADPNREERFTAHAATWLNGERWNDPPLPSRTGRPPTSGPRAVVDPSEEARRRQQPAGRITQL